MTTFCRALLVSCLCWVQLEHNDCNSSDDVIFASKKKYHFWLSIKPRLHRLVLDLMDELPQHFTSKGGFLRSYIIMIKYINGFYAKENKGFHYPSCYAWGTTV